MFFARFGMLLQFFSSLLGYIEQINLCLSHLLYVHQGT